MEDIEKRHVDCCNSVGSKCDVPSIRTLIFCIDSVSFPSPSTNGPILLYRSLGCVLYANCYIRGLGTSFSKKTLILYSTFLDFPLVRPSLVIGVFMQDGTSQPATSATARLPIHMLTLPTYRNFHKMVQISVDTGSGRFDYACRIG